MTALVVVAGALPIPALSRPAGAQVPPASPVCVSSTATGSAEGGVRFRFASATVTADCVRGQLRFAFTTVAPFRPQDLDYADVFLNVDARNDTGCEGTDFLFSILGSERDELFVELVRIAGCDDDDFELVSERVVPFTRGSTLDLVVGSFSELWIATGSRLQWFVEAEDIDTFDISSAPAQGSTSVEIPLITPASDPPMTPPTASRPPTGDGYWLLSQDGGLWAFGGYASFGNLRVSPYGGPYVDLVASRDRDGYYMLSARGGVFAFGNSRFFGAVPAGALRGTESAVSVSMTPDGAGYWIFTTDGRVFPFGSAESFGDLANTRLNGPIVSSIPTVSGRGYWMVGSDGGVFAFGDARFYGSMGGQRLNKPVNGIVPDPDGVGYWLVASDGGVFAFEAPFVGSMGATPLNRPVIGMIPYGNGYLMVGSDGGVFTFSNKPFVGSLGGQPPFRPIVAIAS
jgi:hypothetical protein